MSRKKSELTYPWNFIEDVLTRPLKSDVEPEDVERGLEYLMKTVMPERSRTIIELKYQFGFTQTEIARQYGLSPSTIGLVIQKEMRRLRHPSYSIFLLKGYSAGIKRNEEELERQRALEEANRIPERTAGTYTEDILNIEDPYQRIDAIFERGGDDDLWHLDLGGRTYNALYQNGISQIWQLCFCTEEVVLHFRNVGIRTLVAIERALHKWDLALDDGTLRHSDEWDQYVEYAMTKLTLPL